MRLLSPELWLRQAKADDAASRQQDNLAECHRRYLLQQAYEKGVKALALAKLTVKQASDKQFASALSDCFLRHHSPWTVFSTKSDDEWTLELRTAYASNWQHLLKQLKTLRNVVTQELSNETDTKVVTALKQIDATRPTLAIQQVSYRYPFADDAHPDGVAPVEWTGWNIYQGEEAVVRAAVSHLLRRAEVQIGFWQKRL